MRRRMERVAVSALVAPAMPYASHTYPFVLSLSKDWSVTPMTSFEHPS
jgi:hypothetical protein